MALTREDAAALDAADPLASFRERFVFTDEERIYLDGNSLGRLPVATRDRLRDLVEEWGDRLVSGWPDWIDAPARVGDVLAEGVLGAGPGEVIVADSTTVNLFKLCSAALDLQPRAAGHRPRQLPHRPLRARGAGPAARARAADRGPGGRRARGGRGGGPLARRLPHGRARGHGGRHGRGPFARGARGVGPLALGRRAPDRAACRRCRAGGRLHLQVPERRPGRARLPVRGARAAAAAAIPDPGLVRAARPVRHGSPV